MAKDLDGKEILAGALGVLALALGGGVILSIVKPAEDALPTGIPVTAIVGLVAGVIGLYLGHGRGLARQLAVIGTGIALIGLALVGGSIALEALLDASG